MSQSPLFRLEGSAGARRHFRYFDYVMAAFVTILLLSNLIGAGKRAVVDLPFIGPWPFGAGVMFFPISYIIGDVLTEVYGYANARRCIWVGFWALLFMVFMSLVVVALPPDAGWTGQAAYESVFGQTPRIVFASVAAFWAGEFVNSFVLAKMKILTNGSKLWTRTIGSTVFGQAVDSALFYPRLLRRRWLDRRAGDAGGMDPMGHQGELGSDPDTRDLLGRGLPQKARRGGSVRYGHQILALCQGGGGLKV